MSVDESWPLLRRAWVFQERRLSPRMVHFADGALYWECDSAFLQWIGQEKVIPIDWSFIKSQSLGPVVDWRTAVERYSRLDLTYETDRLPAMSAIVKRLQAVRSNDFYVVGMWKQTLLQDLAWVVDPGTELTRPRIPDLALDISRNRRHMACDILTPDSEVNRLQVRHRRPCALWQSASCSYHTRRVSNLRQPKT